MGEKVSQQGQERKKDDTKNTTFRPGFEKNTLKKKSILLRISIKTQKL